MNPLPKTKAQILNQGITPTQFRRNYVRVTRGVYLPETDFPPGGPSELPLLTRAYASQIRFPSSVLGGWAAATLLGINYFQHNAPVHLHVRSKSLACDPALKQRACRLELGIKVWRQHRPRARFLQADRALLDCLIDIRQGRHQWWTPHVPAMTPQEVMSVQVIDAFRKVTQVSLSEVLAISFGRFPRSLLQQLWSLSCDRSDSPAETVSRLMIRGLANWTPQYEFLDEKGWRFTKADFASERHKVAVFYDGEHHNTPKQIAHDKRVDQLLALQGWLSFRITKEQLRDPNALTARLERILAHRS